MRLCPRCFWTARNSRDFVLPQGLCFVFLKANPKLLDSIDASVASYLEASAQLAKQASRS